MLHDPNTWPALEVVDPDDFDPSRLIEGDGTDKLFPTMAEFLDMDLTPPEFLIADMLPVGGIGIVGAKPDVGKSTLLRTLAVAVAKGDSWLGRNVKQGAVLLCQFEEIAAFARNHLVQMGATRETPIYPFMSSCPEDFVSILGNWAERHRPALIIVDTLAKTCPGKDLLDYTVAQQVITPFLAMARTMGTAILFSHHNKKGDSNDPGDDLLGSTAIRANMDHTLHISQYNEARTIKTASRRYGVPLPATYLEIDPVTGRVEAAGTVKEKQGADTEADIVEALRDGPLAKTEIEKAVHGSGRRIRAALDRLLENGEIRMEKEGKAHKFYLSVPSDS